MLAPEAGANLAVMIKRLVAAAIVLAACGGEDGPRVFALTWTCATEPCEETSSPVGSTLIVRDGDTATFCSTSLAAFPITADGAIDATWNDGQFNVTVDVAWNDREHGVPKRLEGFVVVSDPSTFSDSAWQVIGVESDEPGCP